MNAAARRKDRRARELLDAGRRAAQLEGDARGREAALHARVTELEFVVEQTRREGAAGADVASRHATEEAAGARAQGREGRGGRRLGTTRRGAEPDLLKAGRRTEESTMRFDSDIAHDLGTATYAPLSDAGNRPPRVHFVTSDGASVMYASPPGARIHCELEAADRSRVFIIDMRPDHRNELVADVTIHEGGGRSITEETIAIASAIYWSWWRARDMHREAP